PWPRLEQTFGMVRKAFGNGGGGPDGSRIYGFTDAFGATHRSPSEIESLSGWGLQRVYIGLETGHDPLLELVGKQGASQDAVDAVRRLRAGGIEIGAIVLLGLGGDRFSDAHVRDTTRVLNQMGLRAGDMIYFSEMVAPPELEYAGQMAEIGVRPLTSDEMKAQMSAIREGLVFPNPEQRPRMAIYDIRRFVY
ncbi:MAG: radical SAM protein, partial [Candidatus Latescibacteria bacterium]|nr:radical SAM protein [Candidatus Latescibacterota bacterium]